MKGLPISYFKDLQDDKSLVFDGFDTLKDTLSLSSELIKNLKPNKKRMLNMANSGFTTATDFADYLVKQKKIRSGIIQHFLKISKLRRKKDKNLSELSFDEVKKFIRI